MCVSHGADSDFCAARAHTPERYHFRVHELHRGSACVTQTSEQLACPGSDAAAAAAVDSGEVEPYVQSTGFFRNKAKAIQECSLLLCERHGGAVPKSMEELTALPGVARKTANVVLGTAHRIALGIATDTHVMRVSQRLGLTAATKPEPIEQDLCRQVPQEEWTDGGHRILLHGRYVCLAKNPQCEQCPLAELCPSREAEPAGSVAERAERERRVVESRGGKS